MNILQPDTQLQELLTSIDRNEESVIQALHIFIDMLQNLSELSNIIYTPSNPFPIEIYKTFRKLYENSESISNILENYESNNQEFLQQKDQLVAEQIRYMQQIIVNEQDKSQTEQPLYQYKNGRNNKRMPDMRGSSEDDHNTINYLQKELNTMNQALERNNVEFEEEIKKYNNKLYEMKETIQRYEQEFEKMQEYELIIDDLENRIVMMREEKDRDALMIENMAKKIRFFEKEKGGRDAFLSPRYGEKSRLLLSPETRNFNPARSNASYLKKYP